MASAAGDRFDQWQRQRSARLAALPWLRTDNSGSGPVRFVADELLILQDHVDAGRSVLASEGHSASAVHEMPAPPGFRRLRATGMDVMRAARMLHQRTGEVVAGPNHVFTSSPYELGGPYGPPVPPVDQYQLPDGPSEMPTARVAVVDTGVWRASPLPESWYEATATDYEDILDAESDVGHANFITGVILGATSNAHVRIVKVLDAAGVCTEADLAAALLALPPVDVVNLSLGGYTVMDLPPVALRSALGQLLTSSDRVVVAAAGNEGTDGRPFWPAAFTSAGDPWADQVLAVAAHDGSAVCSWSNTGPWVSLAAPGADIISTYVTLGAFTAGVAQWSGTSFAAPRVVAAIAEHHATTGSATEAVKLVRQEATAYQFGGYPGLA